MGWFLERKKCKGGAALKRGKKSLPIATYARFGRPAEGRELIWFFAPDREPSIATSVPVLRVSGLENYRPTVPGIAPDGSYEGSDFRNAYPSGACSSLTGSGQTIALSEFDAYNQTDITAYEAEAGLPNVSVTPIALLTVSGGDGPNGIASTDFL